MKKKKKQKSQTIQKIIIKTKFKQRKTTPSWSCFLFVIYFP